MYKKILVTLDGTPSDEIVMTHVMKLAQRLHSEILLLRVAEGVVARHIEQFKLAESEEMKIAGQQLQKAADGLATQGLTVSHELALGEPAKEIVQIAEERDCDLIAMAAHGHRFLEDIFRGSTINAVRHKTETPVLVVRTPKQEG